MNDDTVSREQAIETVKAYKIFAPTDGVEKTLNAVMDAIVHSIAALPAVERRGRWDNGFCSVCGEEALTEWNDTGGEYAFTKFCPNCGAKMDGEEE